MRIFKDEWDSIREANDGRQSDVNVNIFPALMMVTSLIAIASVFFFMFSLKPNKLITIDSNDLTTFTATVAEIKYSRDDSIYIRLDFNDHTIFQVDTFRIYSCNYQYAINNGLLDEVKAGDSITILTNPNSGKDYYHIYSLEKEDKMYLTIQDTNEGLEIEKELKDAKIRTTMITSIVVFVLFGSLTGLLYKLRIDEGGQIEKDI